MKGWYITHRRVEHNGNEVSYSFRDTWSWNYAFQQRVLQKKKLSEAIPLIIQAAIVWSISYYELPCIFLTFLRYDTSSNQQNCNETDTYFSDTFVWNGFSKWLRFKEWKIHECKHHQWADYLKFTKSQSRCRASRLHCISRRESLV